jgi:hypothetical protein
MIYVSGNVDTGGSKAAAFYILLPIGYLLLLSAALVLVGRAVKRVFMIASAFSLAGVAALRLFGYESANLGLVAIGLLGVLAGYAPLERISSVARRSMLLVAAYGLYLCALTAWDALYPLQIVGVVLSLLLMYSLGLTDADEKSGWLRGHIIRLGQYSLYSYITQIAMLQVLNKAVRNVERGPLLWVASFIAAFVLTSLAVELADWARKRSRPLNEVYKAVFA